MYGISGKIKQINNFDLFRKKDVVWLMGVTITNLGFGDFTPGSQVARSIIALLSLLGIVQTALIVGVLSDILIIPPGKNSHQYCSIQFI